MAFCFALFNVYASLKFFEEMETISKEIFLILEENLLRNFTLTWQNGGVGLHGPPGSDPQAAPGGAGWQVGCVAARSHSDVSPTPVLAHHMSSLSLLYVVHFVLITAF